jgi:pimeloyl-ACP methyl ester carboxylesterase
MTRHPARIPLRCTTYAGDLLQYRAMTDLQRSEQAITFTDPDGHRTAGVITTPPAATDRLVLLCHGFLSNKHSSTNRALTTRLTAQGLATFRFDFFGQGDSEGPFERLTLTTAVRQAAAAVDLVRSKGYRRIGIVGSSFGGLVAILTASQMTATGQPLVSLGLKCPVPDFPEMLRLEFGEQGMERWKQQNLVPDVTGGTEPVRLQYAFYQDCLRYDAYKAAEQITTPTLIVQGDRDEYVGLHQSQRLYEALAGEKRLEVLAGADHSFSKPEDFEFMAAALTNWMVTHGELPREVS